VKTLRAALITALLGLPGLAAEPSAQVNRLVLQLDVTPSNAAAPVDLPGLERAAAVWLAERGTTVVKADGADPAGTRHLKLSLQAVRTPDNLFLYSLEGRCSSLADVALAANLPGGPQRIWFSHHLAGQKGEPGFQEALTAGLNQVLEELFVHPPKREASPQARPGLAMDALPLKVKRQPPAPQYPVRARTNGIEGVVMIDLAVDATGIPVRAAVLSGPAELLMTALRFALQWEFEPAMLNGQPTPARFKLNMPFRLHTQGLPSPMVKRRP
jgi:TonB family protein